MATAATDPFLLREGLGNLSRFYGKLLGPAQAAFGKRSESALSAPIGFQAGGPVGLFTLSGRQPKGFSTYVTCELACYQGQQPSSQGPFELLLTCNDAGWARAVLTAAGVVSFEAALDDGHLVDLGPGLPRRAPLQGLVLYRFSYTRIARQPYCVLRAVGITRAELRFAQQHGAEALLPLLEKGKALAHTDVARRSVNLPSGKTLPR